MGFPSPSTLLSTDVAGCRLVPRTPEAGAEGRGQVLKDFVSFSREFELYPLGYRKQGFFFSFFNQFCCGALDTVKRTHVPTVSIQYDEC